MQSGIGIAVPPQSSRPDAHLRAGGGYNSEHENGPPLQRQALADRAEERSGLGSRHLAGDKFAAWLAKSARESCVTSNAGPHGAA